MSRRPGRIERGIAEVFEANPSMTFTVEDLVAVAYPGINQIEKKHRVAVLRAANRVGARLWWRGWRAESLGHPVIYMNLLDHRSYAIARIRVDNPDYHDEGHVRSHADVASAIDNPEGYHRPDWARRWFGSASEGGAFWKHVELNRAKRAGDHERADEIQKEFDELGAKLMAAIRSAVVGG